MPEPVDTTIATDPAVFRSHAQRSNVRERARLVGWMFHLSMVRVRSPPRSALVRGLPEGSARRIERAPKLFCSNVFPVQSSSSSGACQDQSALQQTAAQLFASSASLNHLQSADQLDPILTDGYKRNGRRYVQTGQIKAAIGENLRQGDSITRRTDLSTEESNWF